MLLSAVSTYLQLTSPLYDAMLTSTSQSLEFSSSGDELYAAPSALAYSVLLWMQFNTPPSAQTTVLTLKSEGKEAVTVAVSSALIQGSVCDACGVCSTSSISYTFQPFKWTHIGISVDSQTKSFLFAVTAWTIATAHVSKQVDLTLGSYDSQTSTLKVSGFLVSYIRRELSLTCNSTSKHSQQRPYPP